ncbi:hypothetical protein BOM24_12565 [Tatumella sp. OPLPL6]|nr:hypothetical protein BOM24_12565 [Tatumella sp. OPLPL6]
MAILRNFSITALPQALEIARYCTRIRRKTEHDQTIHSPFMQFFFMTPLYRLFLGNFSAK